MFVNIAWLNRDLPFDQKRLEAQLQVLLPSRQLEVYKNVSNRILFDQSSAFDKSEPFVYLTNRSNVSIEATVTEANSSLVLGERYHEPLRRTFRKMPMDYLNIDQALLLSLCVKAMKDTLGKEGLVPLALVFADYPKIYTT